VVTSSLAVATRVMKKRLPAFPDLPEVPAIDCSVARCISVRDALCCCSERVNPETKIILDFFCQEFKLFGRAFAQEVCRVPGERVGVPSILRCGVCQSKLGWGRSYLVRLSSTPVQPFTLALVQCRVFALSYLDCPR